MCQSGCRDAYGIHLRVVTGVLYAELCGVWTNLLVVQDTLLSLMPHVDGMLLDSTGSLWSQTALWLEYRSTTGQTTTAGVQVNNLGTVLTCRRTCYKS